MCGGEEKAKVIVGGGGEEIKGGEVIWCGGDVKGKEW